MACYGIVFGGSRGLGFHAARALAGLGCSLTLVARRRGPLEVAASALEDEYGVAVRPVEADIRVSGSVRRCVSEALGAWGRLDYAVMAYGNISREPLELHEAGWEDWMEAAALYIASTGELMRSLIEMNPAKATVILISSFTVPEPMPPLVVSDSARAALSRIARIAARRYPGKLRPIVVMAGSFKTPGALETIAKIAGKRGVDPEAFWKREVEGLSPLARSGHLLEFERFIAMIASSPEYLAGATILFDGATSRVSWP